MVLSHQKLPAMNRAFLKVSTLSSLRRHVRNGHDRTSRRKRRLLSSVAVSSFPTSDNVAGWLPEKMGGEKGRLVTFGAYRL